MIKNKIEQTFGIGGTIFGIAIIAFAIYVAIIASWGVGICMLIVGTYLALTCTVVKINTLGDKNTLKYENRLFGFIRIGYRITILSTMSLSAMPCGKRGRKPRRKRHVRYKVVLLNETGKEISPLQVCRDKITADEAATEYAEMLNLKIQHPDYQ